MSGLSGALDLRPASEPQPIVLVADLLEHLGVADAPVSRQREAVERWLSDPDEAFYPTESLRRNLDRAGLTG